MSIAYVFFNDVAGGSGTPQPQQALGTITCLNGKAADPMGAQYKAFTFRGPDPSGVYTKYNNRFDDPTYYTA